MVLVGLDEAVVGGLAVHELHAIDRERSALDHVALSGGLEVKGLVLFASHITLHSKDDLLGGKVVGEDLRLARGALGDRELIVLVDRREL